MHTDEAVHAQKFARLLEDGIYEYDRNEYHGPTLNYFTLIPAKLAGASKYPQIQEWMLRIVPVFFGVLLILMPLLLVDGLSPRAVVFVSFLTALSPAFVFYSRYYIQEMLLVVFTFGLLISGWRYIKTRHASWALLGGTFAGLMHATKETCIIAFGCMVFALVINIMIEKRSDESKHEQPHSVNAGHIILGVITAIIVSAIFYSSFFTNPKGVLDSYLTYADYLNRAHNNQFHIHPWYYYFDLLTWFEGFEKLTWNEDLLVVLAGFGMLLGLFKNQIPGVDRKLFRFVTLYTLFMILAYSAIPYKTPWSMLGFLHGMILLAAIGGMVFLGICRIWWEKIIVWTILIVFGFIGLGGQAYMGSFVYYADPSNPYVYAHTSKDIFDIVKRIDQIASVHSDGRNMYIQVIIPGGDSWPLPWYLRSFTKVGYWQQVDNSVPSAELIIASPEVEGPLLNKLYNLPEPGRKQLYLPAFDDYMQLRPGVELRGYITKQLWDAYQQTITEDSEILQELQSDRQGSK